MFYQTHRNSELMKTEGRREKKELKDRICEECRGAMEDEDVEREGRGEEEEGGARCGDVNLICTNDCALT